MKAMAYKWKGADRGKYTVESIPAGYLPQFNGGREFVQVENVRTGKIEAISEKELSEEYQKY